MDPEEFKTTMHSLAYGEAMLAAAKDYKEEMIEEQNRSDVAHDPLDVDDFLRDPELERLHEERLSQMRDAAEKRAKIKSLAEMGHGTYQEISEGEFLEVTTRTKRVVCHFFHHGFERCKIVDKHLSALCTKYMGTRFVKVSAMDAPFFTEKLQIKVLPCVVFFLDGMTTDRLVGFDDLGEKDSFSTATLEKRLLKTGIIEAPVQTFKDLSSPTISKSICCIPGFDDESSDFDSD